MNGRTTRFIGKSVGIRQAQFQRRAAGFQASGWTVICRPRAGIAADIGVSDNRVAGAGSGLQRSFVVEPQRPGSRTLRCSDEEQHRWPTRPFYGFHHRNKIGGVADGAGIGACDDKAGLDA